jgi:hypothetical protein
MLTEDIAALLTANGFSGSTICEGFYPGEPDDVITIYEMPGKPPDLYSPCEYPEIQIRVRSKSYATGRSVSEQIYELLHGQANVKLGPGQTWYLLIAALHQPQPIGRDQLLRAEFFCNFRTIKERTCSLQLGGIASPSALGAPDSM